VTIFTFSELPIFLSKRGFLLLIWNIRCPDILSDVLWERLAWCRFVTLASVGCMPDNIEAS
jgi:uncharacterized membrane protein